MMTSEVATARRKGAPSHRVRGGTITNPPRTPKKPVIAPTPRPATATRASGGSGHLPSASSSLRVHVATPATSITGTHARISAAPPTLRLAGRPSSDPNAPGTANRRASRQHTRPWRASDPAPTAAATETTTSEAVEAGPTGWGGQEIKTRDAG